MIRAEVQSMISTVGRSKPICNIKLRGRGKKAETTDIPETDMNAENVNKLGTKNIETIALLRDKSVRNVTDELTMRGYVDHKKTTRNN